MRQFAIAFVVALLLGGCSSEEKALVVPHRLDGTPAVLASDSAITLLHFWATWCPPCREELPAFQRYVARSRKDGIAIVPVAVEPDAREVAQYLSKNGIALDSLFDPGGDFATNYGVEVLPTTLVLDRIGAVIHYFVGVTDWDAPVVSAHLKQLVAAQ
jgi:thiol-disulfide isomerase/thioredoxin